jgi:hypothetical protein
MVSYNTSFSKARPHRARCFYLAIFAAIVILFLLAWPATTGAQIGPIIVPAPTRMPSPPVSCAIAKCVYLSLILED